MPTAAASPGVDAAADPNAGAGGPVAADTAADAAANLDAHPDGLVADTAADNAANIETDADERAADDDHADADADERAATDAANADCLAADAAAEIGAGADALRAGVVGLVRVRRARLDNAARRAAEAARREWVARMRRDGGSLGGGGGRRARGSDRPGGVKESVGIAAADASTETKSEAIGKSQGSGQPPVAGAVGGGPWDATRVLSPAGAVRSRLSVVLMSDRSGVDMPTLMRLKQDSEAVLGADDTGALELQ
eukprot:364583-Chlamydomonas_euryale.AAC.1